MKLGLWLLYLESIGCLCILPILLSLILIAFKVLIALITLITLSWQLHLLHDQPIIIPILLIGDGGSGHREKSEEDLLVVGYLIVSTLVSSMDIWERVEYQVIHLRSRPRGYSIFHYGPKLGQLQW